MSGLYTNEILRLAAASARWTRLAGEPVSAERRSPVCGSRIIVDLRLDPAGRVTDYGHEVRACALGQASATLLAETVPGCNAAALEDAAAALRSFLAGERDDPGEWPGVAVFAAAREYPARHAAILLAFEAAAAAVREGAQS